MIVTLKNFCIWKLDESHATETKLNQIELRARTRQLRNQMIDTYVTFTIKNIESILKLPNCSDISLILALFFLNKVAR